MHDVLLIGGGKALLNACYRSAQGSASMFATTRLSIGSSYPRLTR